MKRRAKLVHAALLLAGLAASPASAQDPYPLGTLSFFNLGSCPTGWATATDAGNNGLNGYLVVPFYQLQPGQVGTILPSVPPLASGEDRTHTHTLTSSISVPEVKYEGIGGCCNDDPANDGTVPVSGSTGAASTGVPTVQLLLCEKSQFTPTPPAPVSVPQYVVTFYNTASCPTGWKSTPLTSGRFLVGLPANGTPEVAFGGNPLTAGENRTHTHTFSGQISVSSAGVSLASGCCAEHYGAQGTYSFSGSTAPAPANLPYLMATQCQPCLVNDTDPACNPPSSSR